MDLFEAAAGPYSPSLSLKQAYRLLRATGARVHLVPADAVQSLVRTANALPGNELVVASADWIAERMSDAWHYIPRMLAPTALLFAAETIGDRLACASCRRRGCYRSLLAAPHDRRGGWFAFGRAGHYRET